jgi:hypothetical protein
MSPILDIHAIKAALRELPVEDRLAILINTVLTDNDLVISVAALINVTARLATNCDLVGRRTLALHMVRQARDVDPRAWN